MRASCLDLDAPEPVVRNAIFVIRLQARLIRLESARVRLRTEALRRESRARLARSRSVWRRSRWLIDQRKPLPRVVRIFPGGEKRG